MSYLVLHMDKFKKNAVRGIQSHNQRERESHSNPDIDYDRSSQNYELHVPAHSNYGQVIQERIASLNLRKAVRKDAVHMCGIIISSDTEFFNNLPPEEQRRFFDRCAFYLTDFVGKENVISAMVHMDEKTPHMHFLHVPVTKDNHLSANSIYTRASLRHLQNHLPQYLQRQGFTIERGVEQKAGSAKKHLNTREYKQQQEAVAALHREAQQISEDIDAMQEQLSGYEQQAQEAEDFLASVPNVPEVSLFNYKSVSRELKDFIAAQQKALLTKREAESSNAWLKGEMKYQKEYAHKLYQTIKHLQNQMELQKQEIQKEQTATAEAYKRIRAYENFLRWLPEADSLLQQYKQEKARKEEEERQQAELERQRKMRLRAQEEDSGMRM